MLNTCLEKRGLIVSGQCDLKQVVSSCPRRKNHHNVNGSHFNGLPHPFWSDDAQSCEKSGYCQHSILSPHAVSRYHQAANGSASCTILIVRTQHVGLRAEYFRCFRNLHPYPLCPGCRRVKVSAFDSPCECGALAQCASHFSAIGIAILNFFGQCTINDRHQTCG